MGFDYRPLIPFKLFTPATARAIEEGGQARTDKTVRMEYDGEHNLPKDVPVQGRGALHFKRTLSAFTLEGRTAVVTGGARGLGLVMAQALVISGANLAIVDLDQAEAEKQAAEIEKTWKAENPGAENCPKITAHYCDVSSQKSVETCFQEVLGAHNGTIDNLVTSAGFTDNINAIDYPIERVRKLFSVDFDGTWMWSVALAKHLMERKAPGSIVHIASMSGDIVNVPQPQAAYNAAKAAVKHLASSFAVEWAGDGIRVNSISPGYMLTPLTKKILEENPDIKRQWTSLIPQGRMGAPEDLMGAVVYLLSDASMYVTGAELRVDGGYTVT
ncbi:MAG: hypothetical protein M1834_004296 [Cirrosporium novae-zelandiae]|nr:MAG: hypothetical protein M1834_004296 [Cirrosporium novae-zelandiae]